MLCSALPFFVLLWHTEKQRENAERELYSYRELEETYHTVSLWVLNTPLNAGDTIQEDDCTKVIVKTQSVTPLSLPDSASAFDGLSAKTALKEGCILTNELFYDAKSHEEDSHLLEVTDLTLPAWISKNDIVDVRIRFPNGEDYIVISHQKVQKLLSDENTCYGVQFELTEEELLRLSSARFDREQYGSCDIYLTKYVFDFQAATQKDYPVNPDVFSLLEWNPNIVTLFTVESEQEKRERLESHLDEYLEKGTSSVTESDSSTEDTPVSGDSPEEKEDSLTVYYP